MDNNLIKQILDFIFGLLQGKVDKSSQVIEKPAEPLQTIEITPAITPHAAEPGIDWANPATKISKYFSIKDAIWLPQWNRLANESDGLNQEIKDTILETAKWMDQIREYFGAPVIVHCWLRPTEYNVLVKGAKNSMHLYGKAVDFHVKDVDCDSARQKILDGGKLEELGLRMEQMPLPKGTWVHLDSGQPNPNRYFKP